VNSLFCIKNYRARFVLAFLVLTKSVALGASEMPPSISIDPNRFIYLYSLPEPFGEVEINIGSDIALDSNATDVTVSYGNNDYVLDQEVWDKVYVLDRPGVAYSREQRKSDQPLEEFQVWLPFGEMITTYRGCDFVDRLADCQSSGRSAVVLTFDVQGLKKVERMYESPRGQVLEYLRREIE